MKRRLHSIDALRGAAAAIVVLYHLWNRYYPGMSTQGHVFKWPARVTWDYIATFPIQYGYLGVTLFFVLSGFCIHYPQARSHIRSGEDNLELSQFARRRALRLYPAYLASILFSALAVGLFPTLLAWSEGRGVDPMATFALGHAAANALFLQQFFPASLGFNGVYWTLLFEVQFYAFYPLLLWAARRFGFGKVLVVLLVVEAVASTHPLKIPCFFLTRYFEWYLGMFAAEEFAAARLTLRARPMFIAGTCGGLLAIFHPVLWPFRDLLFSVAFYGILVYALRTDGLRGPTGLASVLNSKTLVRVGAYSYSLYLIHVPVIDLVWNGCEIVQKKGLLSAAIAQPAAAVCVPLAFALANAFYLLFERPFLGVPIARGQAPAIPGATTAS
jgi:peptidoglycan/LPS O-acetylase OafA/YrhL